MNAVTDTATPDARSAPIKATWVCLAVAWVLFLLPIPGAGLFVGWPLNLVAFILAIVVMTRGRTTAGLIALISSLVVSPIIYFIGLAVLAGTVASGSGFEEYQDKVEAAAAEASATEQVEAAPAIALSARELWLAYDANEVAADGQYKGEQLLVTGTVAGINKNMFDEVYVELDSGEMFGAVHAQGLPTDVAASLAKGQEITVQCEGQGLTVGSPILGECALI